MSLAGSAWTAASGAEAPRVEDDRRRLERMARENFQFIWRSLRRLGVPEGATDDAAQKVFEIATRRLAVIRADAERAFLFHTAVRIAQEVRSRTAARRETSDAELENAVDPEILPDEAADLKRRRQVLDDILDSMPMELRTVLVLFELEGMTTHDVATLLDVPRGTVASRLRRAREHFEAQVKRLRSRDAFSTGEP
jgi:RNA polymerase sigma-70 factor (ECF subfamily)